MRNLSSNKLLTIGSILLIVINIVVLSILWADHHHQGPGGHQPPPSGQDRKPSDLLVRQLGLDSAQQEKFSKLREEHHATQQALLDSMHKAKDEFFELVKQQNITDADLKQKADKAAGFMSMIDMLTIKHFQQVRAICTPDQQKKFDEVIMSAMHGMPKMMNAEPRDNPGRRDSANKGHQPNPPEDGPPPPPDRNDGPPPGGEEHPPHGHPGDRPPPSPPNDR